jgi:addiction module RelE/StbE family toxin
VKYKFSPTKRFQKQFQSLTKTEKRLIQKKLELMAENPDHPSLRIKKIQGTSDIFECSVNMDIRIIWCYEENTIILLIDVGHHNILKRY